MIPTEHALETPEIAARVKAIRRRLPGQMVEERLELARLHHGELYTMEQIRQRVAESLPRRLGYVRTAELQPIETYRGEIPAAALLKYDDALASGLFATFWVATPRYYQSQQVDPWLVGEVVGADRYSIIARWD